ncbi:scarecrow-like protein 4 [Cocos nucifera]|uniref:Scarecrow-like protein 4 n=1 Tax=Cocos nucifera TaxID=13894 RepID=A0A8K0IT28_COCNU|nr:scarecrow-like protein 4 [Cocos nucifera]
MAYMCADSGNLMAIAQQVIQQKQQQQQQRQQQQQGIATSVNPFYVNAQPWGPNHHHPIPDNFPFVLPDSADFHDPFASDSGPGSVLGFHPSVHLDHGPFRLSDFGSSASAAAAAVSVAGDFDSDEWMESLIGESPAESSHLMSDAWQGGGAAAAAAEIPPLFPDAFASCSAAITVPSPASTSDLNRVVFSDPAKISTPAAAHHQTVAVHSPNPALPPQQVPVQTDASPASTFDLPPQKNDASSGAEVVRDPAVAGNPPSPSPPLLQALLDCARIADSDPDLAAKSLDKIRESASDLGDPTERVAFYFAEALYSRLSVAAGGPYRKHPSSPPPSATSYDSSTEDFTLCYKAFNDACPYSKFAHLTANQAILEATESASRIHIIDFGIMQGVQWAALLQALATRPAGKPAKIRISGIPAPALGDSPAASLAITGNRLRNFAALLDLDFDFEPVLTPFPELSASTFRVEPGESVAVNFMLQLYTLLGDSTDLVEQLLRLAKSLGPAVVTLGEYEANLNRFGFVERFGAALACYAAVFESLEPGMDRASAERFRVERLLFGHRIRAAVGPGKGANRQDGVEGREEWTALMGRCGLGLVAVSNYAVSQAKLLLWNYDYSSKYKIFEFPPGFLSLAWKDRPLLTVSSWH